MSYLGLDIGTGGCKAAAFNPSGQELASAFREYSVVYPSSGHAELDPDEVINKCFEVIRNVNTRIADPVMAMSISSQGEAFTAIDVNGKALCNAMVSSDFRASKIAFEWSREFGEEKIYYITGHTPHPLFSLFKILWLKENRPDLWNRANYFLCFEDLFHYRLGLDPKISWPLAGRTMMFDVTRHKWSRDILDAMGLVPGKLAFPVPSGEISGTISMEAGNKLGFKNPVIIVAGGHDQTCAALGAGVIEPGLCMYATGSVECFCPMFDQPRFSEDLRLKNLCCYDYSIKGKYTTVAYSLTGGNILRWVRDELGEMELHEARETGKNPYNLLLDEMPGSPTELHVLPYFSATGTPYFDTRARGVIMGLQHSTKKGEITKALLEGVAMEMKLNLAIMEKSGMKVHTFIATGGGTRHNAWTQLKADILNRKIIIRETSEAGCYGAAILAQSAHEGIPILELHPRVSPERIFIPDMEKAALYQQKYEVYNQMYPLLKRFWEKE